MARKTLDVYHIENNYGKGWESDCCEFTYRDALRRVSEYRTNSPYPVRIKKRREKRSDYDAAELLAIAEVIAKSKQEWLEQLRTRRQTVKV
jgi:hypothetical protein